jgi:NADH:ubiquinone oxidoreductase subunit F (NADH-binding)/NADH:ubiquinone oxidoreductase subunit E
MQVIRFNRAVGRPKGRQAGAQATERLAAILGPAAQPRRDLLIEHLHRIQDAEGQLPYALLAALAQWMRLSQVEVFEVASFYHHFDPVADDAPGPAALTVRVCDSLSCELAGAASLAERLEAALGREVRVLRVPCVGRCAHAPVAVVHRLPVERANVQRVLDAVGARDRECPLPAAPDYARARGDGAYAVLRSLVAGARTAEQVFAELESAGLRGMGGAGFSAGRKWRIVSQQSGPRLLVVNADEGEPGTFKDRFCLESAPHRFLEGMLIAAWAVGCPTCTIYLRDEYSGVRAMLEREIAALLDDPPIPRAGMPAIELRRGAGAYICGEESALIESIEGKRGMPRLRPPYVAQVGLFGRPTLVNNVETLYWVPEVLARGAHWFGANGRRGRHGLRLFSVSGRVRDPGVKLAPAGISLRELVDEHCGGMADGHALYAYLPGGASGGILPASLADLPLDFDTLQAHGCFIGSAAVIVLSQQDRARDAAANLMRFFRHESCGQCTPCRAGTAKALDLLAADRWDGPLLRELSSAMADASICGLGQAAPNPVLSVLDRFAHEVGGEGGA